jgi:2-polyprenyl-3-methyl-5-hydroxy-6-metoxy-1,4-benzoquinol methylase
MNYNTIYDKNFLCNQELKEINDELSKTLHYLYLNNIPFIAHMATHVMRRWEYCTAIHATKPNVRNLVIDIGGAGTIFGAYIANQNIRTIVTDMQDDKLKVASDQANKFNFLLSLKNDITIELDQSLIEKADIVYCISVIEHIKLYEKQLSAMRGISNYMRPNGIAFITFNYGYSKRIENSIMGPDHLKKLISESGLKLLGEDWDDKGLDWHKPGTYGSVLLGKA